MSHRLLARTGLTAALAVMTLAMLVLARQPFTTTHPQAEVGKTAPDFTLPSTTGHSLTLSHLRGQTVVLFFGCDTCPLSQTYADKLLTLAQSLGSAPVTFLAINANPHRLPGTSPTLLNSLSIPTLLDPDANLARTYGATVTPTFFVIDPAGTLSYAGAFDSGGNSPNGQYLARAIERSIDGVPCEVTSTQPFGRSLGLLP